MTARPELTYAEFLDAWRTTHGLEADRMRGGFLDRYYRLPYAIARPLAIAGISPNSVTVAGLGVTVTTLPAYQASGRWPLLAAVLVLLGGLYDQVDGALAVLSGRATAFGAVFDSAVDRLADLVLVIGPALWLSRTDGVASGSYIGLAAGAAATFWLEYVRARSQAVGHTTRQVVTVAERPTRVVLAAVAAIGVGVWPAHGSAVVAGFGWTLAALCTVSAVRLLVDAARRDDPTTPTTATSA